MKTSIGHTFKITTGLVALFLVSSVVVVAPPSAWGRNKVTATWDEIKDFCGDSNLIGALVEKAMAEHDFVASSIDNFKAPDKATFKYVMSPGDSIADSSVLNDFFPEEFDLFVFILVGNGEWHMEIKDC